MNIGYACRIFENLDSKDYTDEGKIQAIKTVAKMETTNGIKKEHFVKALKFLVGVIDWEDEE